MCSGSTALVIHPFIINPHPMKSIARRRSSNWISVIIICSPLLNPFNVLGNLGSVLCFMQPVTVIAYPFQIGNRIVLLVAIDVVYFRIIVWVRNKSACDKPVNTLFVPHTIFIKVNFQIPFSILIWFENPRSTADSPPSAYLVFAIKSSNVFPYFFQSLTSLKYARSNEPILMIATI